VRPADIIQYRVETHGDAATVDELAGPSGFIDEFGWSECDGPEGPRREDGSYAISLARYITAP
jgi:hypothetical protein